MFARIATRVPITAAFAGKRVAPAAFRCNSSTTTTRASRIVEMAAQAERPNSAEAAVPVMWAVCSALTYVAYNRLDNTASANVDKLIIV